jgi:PPK2 family polyphosphate:nucleotide phosphotransferase
MRDSDLDDLLVRPASRLRLARRGTDNRFGLRNKAEARIELSALLERLAMLQYRLYAERRRSVLLVLQGMDTSGKDGTVRAVFSSVSPAQCRVRSFEVPTEIELRHDYLWRVHAACPARGEIGIFNRSHYEDVVTTVVLGTITRPEARRRMEHIRGFERMLTDEGTAVVKVFLHISPEEQRARLQARLADPEKRWKFAPSDLEARARWPQYQAAYERALVATSTDDAPWYVVPADRKWVRNVVVARLLVRTLTRMRPQTPPDPPGLDEIVIA